MKIKQIWVMWSQADLWYKKDIENIAFELWQQLALNNNVLVYWAEKDSDSLSSIAARGAKGKGGLVVWITYWNTPDIWWDMDKYTDVIINTWMLRWWWREFVLVSSCDALIVIWWGSWTLNEITVAYQKKIPIVVIEWTWWWADKLKNQYLDERYKNDPDRFICKWVKNAKEAVEYLKNLT
jgi:uncharacterized protein (TIGR00725 family)